MNETETRMDALSVLEETVRADASGEALPNPDREFLARWVIRNAAYDVVRSLWAKYRHDLLAEES